MSWAARVDVNADGLPVSEQEDDDEDLQKALQVSTSAPCICRCCFVAQPQTPETASGQVLAPQPETSVPNLDPKPTLSKWHIKIGQIWPQQQVLHVLVCHAFKVMTSVL
jgi:hypothetical protein